MKFAATASITLLLIASYAAPIRATAPNDLKKPVTSHCLTPTEIQPIHLYGLWQAEFGNMRPRAIIRLVRHPEWTGSVRGEVDRAGAKSQVAGDVDQGELMLDESNDGQTISATWFGVVVAQSCGKEIKGTWTDNTNNISTSFVLRKQAGWQ